MGVNPHYVTDAKKIEEAAPALADEVRRGELSIPEAKRKLRKQLQQLDQHQPENDEPKRPESRRTSDLTVQKRYEHLATAAMGIANRNPEGEVERQIIAAAEQMPAPLMPLSPDIYTEVLAFITKVSGSVADDGIKAEARRLLSKMRLYRPTPNPAEVLAEATKEEKRNRDRRLARSNGGPLGSAGYNPPAKGTAEYVQSSEPTPATEAGPNCMLSDQATKREKTNESSWGEAQQPSRADTTVRPDTTVVVKPGFTAKYNGQQCDIVSVSPDGCSADLRVVATGEELHLVRVAELRYVVDPDSV